MADIIKITECKDECTPFVCKDCRQNNWKLFIYSLPCRIVLECQNCEGYYEMDVEP